MNHKTFLFGASLLAIVQPPRRESRQRCRGLSDTAPGVTWDRGRSVWGSVSSPSIGWMAKLSTMKTGTQGRSTRAATPPPDASVASGEVEISFNQVSEI